MPRRPRISIPGIASHVIQRGNNRQVIFKEDSDKIRYLNWLQKYSAEFNVSIHAWVLMSNHVHILCTPDSAESISLMMQSIGRVYVMYFNNKYDRTGTLWEGRFRSCLVQDDNYLLELYRYIELNPIRAGLAETPGKYSWSSYQCNGLGKDSELVNPHPLYFKLGKSKIERLDSYNALLSEKLNEVQLLNIREASNKQLALGDKQFIEDAQTWCGQRLIKGQMGRPASHVKTGI